jgi:hypothetical protein
MKLNEAFQARVEPIAEALSILRAEVLRLIQLTDAMQLEIDFQKHRADEWQRQWSDVEQKLTALREAMQCAENTKPVKAPFRLRSINISSDDPAYRAGLQLVEFNASEADGHCGNAPWWLGQAVRAAFWAGVLWQRSTERQATNWSGEQPTYQVLSATGRCVEAVRKNP